MSKINQLNPDVFFVKQDLNKIVWFWVKAGKLDEFLADTSALENFLKSTNHYSDASIKTFCEKIENSAESTPTEEEIEANKQIIASNWKELLQTITNPEIRKRFLAFQTTYTCMTEFKDAALSPANVTSVLMADPQATFVTDKSTWETKFNRKVQNGAPFVIITKAENSLPPINLLNKDPEVMRAGGWNAIVKMSGGPWYGAAYAAIKRVRIKNGVTTSFYRSKVYDVRFTTPMNPNDDVFMKIPNLVNNLTGEINMAAKALLDKNAAETGQKPMDYDAKREGITTSEELVAFKEFILDKCKKLKLNVSEVGSDADIVANAVYAYAYHKAESLNKLKDNVKATFANAVCYAIAITFNVESNRSNSCAQYIQNISPQDAENIAMDSFETYRTLANFTLRESVDDEGHVLSFDEYVKLLVGQSKNKQQIKSKFNDITNRMNAL